MARPIQFEHLKRLALVVYDRHTTADKFPLVCDKLEHLEVHCYAWRSIWFDFARTNDLTKLTLLEIFGLNGGPSIQFLLTAAAYWPNLSEITVQVDALTSNEIVQLIANCKHLQRLEICDQSQLWTEKYNELNLMLEREWKLEPMTARDLKYAIIRMA